MFKPAALLATGPLLQEDERQPVLRMGSAELELELINTNPYDTKAIAVSRSGCACGAQKVRVC
jgi:hypothetical protein